MPELDVNRPFTSAAARAAGLSVAQLKGPRFRAVLRGVHVTARASVDLRLRSEAALLIHPPGAVVTHQTSAMLQDLPVPEMDRIHVSVPRAKDRRRGVGIVSHVGRPQHTRRVGEMRVSTGASLFRELGRVLPLVDLVVVGDALVRRGLASVAELRRCAPDGTHTHRAAAYVRARVDSPMESRMRMLLVLAGFPEPVVNAAVAAGAGEYRPDLSWAHLRLVVEYDGRHHRADLDQWDHDLVRREWFEGQGWTMIVLVARDLFQRPDEVVNRVAAAWSRCGGAPLVLGDEWRAHFPVRAAA